NARTRRHMEARFVIDVHVAVGGVRGRLGLGRLGAEGVRHLRLGARAGAERRGREHGETRLLKRYPPVERAVSHSPLPPKDRRGYHEIGGRMTLKGCSVSFLSPSQIWITQRPGTRSERASNFQVRNSSSPVTVLSTYSSATTGVFPSPERTPSGGNLTTMWRGIEFPA